MVSMPEMIEFGQKWWHRLTDRVEELPGAKPDRQDKFESLPKRWPAPAFFIRFSKQAKTLFKAMNHSTLAIVDSGKQKITALYNSSAQRWLVGVESTNSKAFYGEKTMVAGRWSRDALHVSLSNVGHLAGGIFANHSIVPENRRQFVEKVVAGRSSGRYDAGVFQDVRELFKRDAIDI